MDLTNLAEKMYKKEIIHAQEICPACAKPMDAEKKKLSAYHSRTICGSCFGNAVFKAQGGMGCTSAITQLASLKLVMEACLAKGKKADQVPNN